MSKTEVPRSNLGEIWHGESPGDKLVGEFMGKRQTKGKFGDQTAIDIRTKEGQRTIFANKVLLDFVDNMEKGKVYEIVFLGWGKEKLAKKTVNSKVTANWKNFKVYAVG